MRELQLLDDHNSYLIFLPFQTFFYSENVERPSVIVVRPKNVLCPSKVTNFLFEFVKIATLMLLKKSKFFFPPFFFFFLITRFFFYFRKKSLARFHDMKHCVRYMSYDENRKMMLTIGPDHIIKVWSMKGIL